MKRPTKERRPNELDPVPKDELFFEKKRIPKERMPKERRPNELFFEKAHQ